MGILLQSCAIRENHLMKLIKKIFFSRKPRFGLAWGLEGFKYSDSEYDADSFLSKIRGLLHSAKIEIQP